MTDLNGNSCVHQVKALRSAYVTEEMEHCRTCTDYNCVDYKPIRIAQVPFRRGSLACVVEEQFDLKNFGMGFK